MTARWHLVAWSAGALVLGAVAALFFVFAGLFTDGPSDPLHPERLVSTLLTLAAYATGCALLHRFVPAPPGWWAGWLGITGLLVVIAYQEPPAAQRLVAAAALLVGCAAGSWGGMAWGRAARRAETG